MRAIPAVAERELRSAFRQPVGYIVMGAYLVLHGVFFTQLMQEYSSRSFQVIATGGSSVQLSLVDLMARPLLVADSFVLMLLLPALTMRQLADEWRSGTSDLLLSYPLSEAQIVLGKFLGSACLLLVIVVVGALYPAMTAFWGRLEIPVLLVGQLGLLLYGLSVLSIGLWMSALTENQVIAFAATLMALMLLMGLGFWGTGLDNMWGAVLRHLSFSGHVGHFGFGVWSLSSTVFFVGLSAFFLLLATGSVARRRWGRG